jgi:hypothetical protein
MSAPKICAAAKTCQSTVSAIDRHTKRVDFVLFIAIRRQNDVFPIETKPGKAKPEVFCSAYRLQEMWGGKDKSVVEPNIEHLEEYRFEQRSPSK